MDCHFLLLLPVLGLGLFFSRPWPIALALYLPILGGSLWMYVKMWEAMRQPILSGPEALIGAEGEALGPDTARVLSEMWRVQSNAPLRPRMRVRVVAREGLTLLVEPMEG
ncbi:MAG: hypothetical protein HY260_05770 [Chloroflexi bacterium]|nr:hypothetical protein [Chloroflexota bacterium]